MKKILITIRNLILGLILIVYLTFIIAISTLLLNRNDYGMTQFGDKTLILLEQEVSNQKYKKGSLVITESKKISELKVDVNAVSGSKRTTAKYLINLTENDIIIIPVISSGISEELFTEETIDICSGDVEKVVVIPQNGYYYNQQFGQADL